LKGDRFVRVGPAHLAERKKKRFEQTLNIRRPLKKFLKTPRTRSEATEDPPPEKSPFAAVGKKQKIGFETA